MSTWTVPVSGLACKGCVETVTGEITRLDGVEQVSIDLVPGGVSQVCITAAAEIADEALQGALASDGAFTIAR